MGTLKELLAKPDAVCITMPAVSRETMQKVLELIGRDAAAGRVQVDTPTRNLESYFLEVVRKARESMSETSGATSGSTVASYLRGDAEAPPAADRILERLTAPTAPAAVAPAAPPAPAARCRIRAGRRKTPGKWSQYRNALLCYLRAILKIRGAILQYSWYDALIFFLNAGSS